MKNSNLRYCVDTNNMQSIINFLDCYRFWITHYFDQPFSNINTYKIHYLFTKSLAVIYIYKYVYKFNNT